MIVHNAIAVFSASKEQILMCKRRKEPYQGLLNFVGGKVKSGEDGLDAAYRELWEETAIARADITLSHVMDFTYYYDSCCLQVDAGRLDKAVDVRGDENELCWLPLDQDFFDPSRYAGEGNIGHILMQIQGNPNQAFR